jgi:glutamyl-tRNA synthetase
MTPRLRFAPSPTGNLHIGTLRTALFNWIFAKAIGATLILRIEDTDRSRSESEFETNILQGLEWLGLTMDEGPYRQSERTEHYHAHAHRLLESGKAYRCFCTEAELDRERAAADSAKRPYVYSGKCRALSPVAVAAKQAEGIPHTIKFHVATGDAVIVADIIRGNISFERAVIGDFVLVKSDQTPSYNFAVVVDDAMMDITHVIRGEDHISNTPKQILLFEALGYPVPQFAHLPMILGPDKSKLSKRHGATGVTEYRAQGFIADAMFNYLVLLGWSAPDGREVMTPQDIIDQFALERISKSGAVFDITKLKWMNGQYIRRQTPDQLWALVSPYISSDYRQVLGGYSDAMQRAIVYSVRDNLDVLTDIDRFLEVYVVSDADYSQRVSEFKFESDGVIPTFVTELHHISEWTAAAIDQAVEAVVAKTGLGKGKVFKPIRVAVSGFQSGPHLGEFIFILGRDKVLTRLSEKEN